MCLQLMRLMAAAQLRCLNDVHPTPETLEQAVSRWVS